MIKSLLCALALFPGIAFAVICKSVDAEGTVTYTDVPVEQCENKVQLRGLSGYTPRPIAPPSAGPVETTANQPPFPGYESIQILQPEPEGTVRSNEGKVPVAVALTPGLQSGHKMFVYIDGRLVPGGFDATAIELSGVDRGTHSLRASVKDENGHDLIDSAEVRFTLRKTGLNERAPRPPTIQPVPRPR